MIERYRDLAAAERTFLAWIRTAVSITGFGVLIEQISRDGSVGVLTYATMGVVGLGALLILFSALHFLAERKRIMSENVDRAYGIRFQIVFGLMISVLIALIAVFLVRLSDPIRAPAQAIQTSLHSTR